MHLQKRTLDEKLYILYSSQTAAKAGHTLSGDRPHGPDHRYRHNHPDPDPATHPHLPDRGHGAGRTWQPP